MSENMTRLIDADALKKDLTRFYYGDVTARELIDEQPTIGWISVKDHMPERGMLCFVYDGMRICAARYITGNEWVHGLMLGAVTHWMPMIEPPEEVTPDD